MLLSSGRNYFLEAKKKGEALFETLAKHKLLFYIGKDATFSKSTSDKMTF